MLQGTGSDVGKSLLVAGLCRAYSRRGLAVRPFKPQNMSNNAAVTADGGEIGRAQALQARACGIEASVHMNPVLLKPQSDLGAQVVVQGQVRGSANARAFQTWKGDLLGEVLASYGHISAAADLVLIEGAGSPAEINLPGDDIANMGFAAAANVPVVLVADIDRGGVIANLVGTHTLLQGRGAERVSGFLINKFRGDIALFDTGLEEIRRRTGFEALGVVPWFARAHLLPAEDAVALEAPQRDGSGPIRIAVPQLPRIANFDDFDPLGAEPDVALTFVAAGRPLPADADLIILPGSKSTIADMAFVRTQGWDIDLKAHWRRGGRVLGLCGGYQMLGRTIADPDGLEGAERHIAGLALLDVETILAPRKVLRRTSGTHLESGHPVAGYEIHMGRTTGPDTVHKLLSMGGAVSADGRVAGCYLHGLFAADGFRHAYLSGLARRPLSGIAYDALVDEVLDELGAHLERHLDLDRLLELARHD